MVPGDTRRVYEHAAQARQILNDAEDDLRDWQPEPDNFVDNPEVQTKVSETHGLHSESLATGGEVRPTEASGALATDDTKVPEGV